MVTAGGDSPGGAETKPIGLTDVLQAMNCLLKHPIPGWLTGAAVLLTASPLAGQNGPDIFVALAGATEQIDSDLLDSDGPTTAIRGEAGLYADEDLRLSIFLERTGEISDESPFAGARFTRLAASSSLIVNPIDRLDLGFGVRGGYAWRQVDRADPVSGTVTGSTSNGPLFGVGVVASYWIARHVGITGGFDLDLMNFGSLEADGVSETGTEGTDVTSGLHLGVALRTGR